MKTATKTPSLTTAEMMIRLKARYADFGYAVLTEVADGTGSSCSRWADALVMSLWPSRGLELHGFEVKVSRGDWKKELADPKKAEAICKYCDRWWIVAGSKDIVPVDELPKTWGLLAAHGNGLKVMKPAPELSPIPFDRKFIASVFRRADEQAVDAAVLKIAIEKAVSAAEAEWEQNRKNEYARSLRHGDPLAVLRKQVDDFEKFAGFKITHRYAKAKQVGLAVKVVLENFGWPPWYHNLGHLKSTAKAVLEAVEKIEREAAAFPEIRIGEGDE